MSENEDLWNNVDKAQEIFKKKRKLEGLIAQINKLESEVNDLKDL